MKKKLRQFFALTRKNSDGFTLVELIVVIAILGILAGVGTVGYSGYIKKANAAADEVLLSSLNTAFAAACIENGVDPTAVRASGITFTDSDKTVDENDIVLTHAKAADIKEAFFDYYDEDAEFKVYTALNYENGKFVDAGAGNAGGEFVGLLSAIRDALGADAIEQASNSNLGSLGTEALFNQMNGAMDTAGELNLHTLTGAPFLSAYYGYLGFDPTAYGDDNDAAQEALDALYTEMGVDPEDYEQTLTHAIALYAAENATSVSTDRLSQWLGGGKTTDDLQANANADTLADTAAIYSLYLSYNKKNNTEVTGNTLEVMTDALTDNDFAAWVSTDPVAQDELTAYKTYMNIVNEAIKDEAARNEILVNGFNNAEMQSLVKELMGK